MMIELGTHTGQIHTLTLIELHHQERSSYQSRYGNRDRHHSYLLPKDQHQYNQANHHYHNNSNVKHNAT